MTVLAPLQAHPGGGTHVGTKLNAEARYGGSLEGVRGCTSTGKLETFIVQRLLEHLKS